MNMGWVIGIFGFLLALAIALPGLLLSWALLLPATVERVRRRAEAGPWRCFGVGLAVLLVTIVALGLLFAIAAGPLQMLAWAGLAAVLALASLGMAGLAALMGERMRVGPPPTLTPGSLVRSAVALELAVMVPVLGWFFLFPAVVCVSLGAAALALLRRAPRPLAAVEVAHGPQPS